MEKMLARKGKIHEFMNSDTFLFPVPTGAVFNAWHNSQASRANLVREYQIRSFLYPELYRKYWRDFYAYLLARMGECRPCAAWQP
jgi:hypothetical protein